MRRTHVLTASLLAGGLVVSSVLSSPPESVPGGNTDKPYSPKVAPASNEAARALKRIRVPQGLRLDLFAAEPLVANPVCFCIDEHNRFYVAETFRLHAGVTDDRGHMNWLDDDLAAPLRFSRCRSSASASSLQTHASPRRRRRRAHPSTRAA